MDALSAATASLSLLPSPIEIATSDAMYALLPTANPDLFYDESKMDVIISGLCKGEPHFLYGPGGTGKTYEILQLVERAATMGRKIVMTALSNDMASRLKDSKGIFQLFALKVDSTGKTGAESKMDSLCRSLRRANPKRELDNLWDDIAPSKADTDAFRYTKPYLAAKGLLNRIHQVSDAELIASIDPDNSRYLQKDCADAYQLINSAHAIVFEELFTISDKLFETIDRVLRKYRRCDRPMGGLGFLGSGDVLQTKPVSGAYIHKSPLWRDMTPKVHLFAYYKRFDPKDSAFISFQSRARRGTISDEDHEMLMSRRECVVTKKMEYAVCRTREQAALMNATEYQKLIDKGAQSYLIAARDTFYSVSKMVTDRGSEEELLTTIMSPTSIALAQRALGDISRTTELLPEVRTCVGARVIIKHNDRLRDISNGNTGTITEVGMIRYTEQESIAAGGKKGRIDWVEIVFDRVFTHEIADVWKQVPRQQSAGDSFVLQEEYGERKCVVQKVEGGLLHTKDTFRVARVSVKHSRGGYAVQRVQFPFDLAWGITIYKAQGATLKTGGSLILSGRMNPGEAYVGCSRFVCLDHIVIRDDYSRNVFYAHPEALDFDTQIQETGVWIPREDPSETQSHIVLEHDGEEDEHDEAAMAFMRG